MLILQIESYIPCSVKQIGTNAVLSNGLTSCELKALQYTWNLFFTFFLAHARTSFPIITHGSCSAHFWQVVEKMSP